ncbi:inositol monophosphatase family protein [uncultured Devosia sp.]|uniref:inositol monophosphatase family protein n=1 Tax=uncultured Devosia sp. TaxID=211434 RepID=UPI0035C9BEB1
MKIIGDDLLQALMDDMALTAQTEILPRFNAIAADAVRTKTSPDDLVTDADIGAERLLGTLLADRLGDLAIVGEEAVSNDAAILSRLADADLVAIIDPVDGTWNFAHGVPLFGSILAIVAGGETIAGLIHYPVTGDFLVARPGRGAWQVTAAGVMTRLSVAPPSPIGAMHGFVPLQMFPADMQTRLGPRLPRFLRTTSWNCSAFEYRMLATGAMSFCLNASLMPWDHAAGALIHKEAGGYSALLTGQAYGPTMRQGQLLLAPDQPSWQAVRAALMDD